MIFDTEELIKATNDLIKYSKNDFVDKSFLKNHDNDNRKSLDTIFHCTIKNSYQAEYGFKKYEDHEC